MRFFLENEILRRILSEFFEPKSFDDSGMPEIPTWWKRECEPAKNFNPKVCNKKLIGVRYFSKGYHMATGGGYLKKPKEIESPRDQDGHGTHIANTAAGSQVANASLLGNKGQTTKGNFVNGVGIGGQEIVVSEGGGYRGGQFVNGVVVP